MSNRPTITGVGVKFYTGKRIVIVTFQAKNPRKIVFSRVELKVDGVVRQYRELNYRIISLGRKSNWRVVVAGFEYSDESGKFLDSFESGVAGVAVIQATITNEDFDGESNEYVIDEEEKEPQSEPGDEPTP